MQCPVCKNDGIHEDALMCPYCKRQIREPTEEELRVIKTEEKRQLKGALIGVGIALAFVLAVCVIPFVAIMFS